jgi:hypothetical protein
MAISVRIVSWNCGSDPDVAIVQECANLEMLARKAPEFAPTNAFWTGDNPHRGLAVFSFGQSRLCRGDDASNTYALRVSVAGPHALNLVALWSHYGRSPMRVGAPGPTLLALRAYARFLNERPAIMRATSTITSAGTSWARPAITPTP